jgi:hypothetical protein
MEKKFKIILNKIKVKEKSLEKSKNNEFAPSKFSLTF